jgi:hypothetical protein
MICEASKDILKGVELERCEASLCEPASLAVSANSSGSSWGWRNLPARGSLARSLHDECVHQIVLVPYLRDVGGRRILSTVVPGDDLRYSG